MTTQYENITVKQSTLFANTARAGAGVLLHPEFGLTNIAVKKAPNGCTNYNVVIEGRKQPELARPSANEAWQALTSYLAVVVIREPIKLSKKASSSKKANKAKEKELLNTIFGE